MVRQNGSRFERRCVYNPPDNSTEELEERSKEKENADTMQSSPDYASDVPDPKSVTYVDHDDPFSLVDQSSGAPHIRTLSRHAWVGCGGDVYVLECMGKGFIRIESATSEGHSNSYTSLRLRSDTHI